MHTDGTPGQSTDAYYRQALREWRRAPALVALRTGGLAAAAVALAVELAWLHHTWSWLLGAVAALGLLAFSMAWDWAPDHIDRWRVGAEAERRTADELAPLVARGWRVLHDISTGHGNIDHVLVGPGGVFVLETKHYLGTVTAEGDLLRVQRRANPRGGYTAERAAGQARACAVAVRNKIAEAIGSRQWVGAVVVLWSGFPQEVVEGDRVVFVHGTALADWLGRRPQVLRPERAAAIAAGLASWREGAAEATG